MRKPDRRQKDEKDELEALFNRAALEHDQGNFKSAFRRCLAPAKKGNERAQLLLGYFYISGIGVKPNRDLALYWTRRAYRQGSSAAAHNIGLIFRDERNFPRSITWFERAARLNDADAYLEIAKIYLEKQDRTKAIHYLKQTLAADPIFMLKTSRDEAKHLLKQTAAPLKGKPGQ
jgi:TPR repeat protein